MAALTVEEVGKGLPGREFADLAVALGGGHPGAGWLLAGQRRRLRVAAPPGGEAALLLARRDGQPIARLTAHCQADGEGCFGFLAVAGPGDLDAVEALLAAAAAWLAERGPATVIGPVSWTAADEAGVMIAGNEQPAVTARAWNPLWYRALLEAAGLVVAEEMASYRLPTTGDGPLLAPAPLLVPSDLAPFADPALLLSDPATGVSVAAVPDIAGGLGQSGRGHGPWSMARQARRRDWAGCVVTALDGPPEILIPGLCAAAGRAGYQWVLSPWAPPGQAPVMRHRLYRADLAALSAP